MNYWLHRISHHAELSYPLLNNGYLSIGYSDFSNSIFLENIKKQNGWQNFENCIIDKWGALPRHRYTLWRFIAEMKKGDIVIIPSWNTFSVYSIATNDSIPITSLQLDGINDWNGNKVTKGKNGLLYTANGDLFDLGFVRKVKPISIGISRYEYADTALTSRMKIRQTNVNINDLSNNVTKALDRFSKCQPINIYSNINNYTSLKILETIKSDLSPVKFEYLVKWYFKRVGASEVYIPAKNTQGKEGDADIVAVFEAIRTIIYAQVKFHKGKTTSWAVKQIIDYKNQKERMDDGYSKIGWVITSANSFSEESLNYAKESNIQLISGIQFSTMILEAGIANLGNAI